MTVIDLNKVMRFMKFNILFINNINRVFFLPNSVLDCRGDCAHTHWVCGCGGSLGGRALHGRIHEPGPNLWARFSEWLLG